MTDSRVRPIRRYSGPCVPRRDAIDRDPALLQEVPKRWHGNQVVMSALAASCLLMSSRGLADRGKKATPISRVAPVFQHGYGHTVPGTMSGPVFLPEDEARQLIEEEAKRAGLAFVTSTTTVPNVGLTMKAWGKRDQYVTWKTAVKLDGADAARRIAYEYVSADDSREWSIGSVNFGQGYNSTFDAATRLQEGLAKAKPQGTQAVFYDPVGGQISFVLGEDEATTKAIEAAKQASREELRKQVQDFIKWLRSQGVI